LLRLLRRRGLIAEDAAELVEVEYEPIRAGADRGAGVEGMKLWCMAEMGTNRNWHGVFEYGDIEKAFKQASSRGAHRVGCIFIASRARRWENNAG